MNITDSTSYLFSEVSNKYRSDFEKVMARIGLHGGQVFVLQLLFEEDRQSQIDLASKLSVAPPTISNMVKSLQSNSFVKCEKCPFDKRVIRVSLTEKAKELQLQIVKEWSEFERNFFAALTPTEKLMMFQLLEKLKVVS